MIQKKMKIFNFIIMIVYHKMKTAMIKYFQKSKRKRLIKIIIGIYGQKYIKVILLIQLKYNDIIFNILIQLYKTIKFVKKEMK